MFYRCYNFIKWLLRGKPVKVIVGGHCGLCGSWVADARRYRDYLVPDRWTICQKCKEAVKIAKRTWR